MSEEHLSPLEVKALQEALKGPELWKSALRAQVPRLRAIGREGTGVGGYTRIALDGEYPVAEIGLDEKGYPPAVDVRHPQMLYGGAFIVWTEEGRIFHLEYYVNGDENWPEHAEVDSFIFSP